MTRQGQGLTDKLYWRWEPGAYHCYRKVRIGSGRFSFEYQSLCGRGRTINPGMIKGQGCRRPEPGLRCGICDGKEMERRGWAESGPASPREPGTKRRTT